MWRRMASFLLHNPPFFPSVQLANKHCFLSIIIDVFLPFGPPPFCFLFYVRPYCFSSGLHSRGQPITTSPGKWLQLLLTISDVVDLSRFRFDLTYRVLPRAESGSYSNNNNSSLPISYYGDPVPGTLCSRNLHSCDQRTCIIQSPNFPGLYPR